MSFFRLLPLLPLPFLFLFLILMRVHRVRTNANTCGYDVLYQNTVLHLSCHELYVAHLVCLGLRYVSFFLYYVYNEERRINREIRFLYAIRAEIFSLVSPLMHVQSSIEPFHLKVT